MFEKLLQSLEDPQRPLLGPNFWLLKKIGLVLPESKIGKFCYYMVHTLATLFIFAQYMEIYEIRSDLNAVLTNIRLSMLSTVCVMKGDLFLLYKNKWMEIINYVTEAHIFEMNNPVSEKSYILLDSCKKYCRKVTYTYWCLVFVTAFTMIITPAVVIYFSSPSYREGLRNGTEPFPHIISSWTMFNKNESPGVWIVLVWDTAVIYIYGSPLISSYDSTVMVIMHFFGVKLDLLRERCRVMFGTDETGVSDDEAHKVVRQLHNIHTELLKYSRMLNSVLSPIMFFYMIMCTFMLCTSAIQLTTTTNQTEKIFMALFLTFGISQLFIFCRHSNDVLYKSEEVMRGPYESQWWAMNVKNRKLVLMLAGQFGVIQRYTAGPFTDLTLASFVNILKGSYSYYTLLRNSGDK